MSAATMTTTPKLDDTTLRRSIQRDIAGAQHALVEARGRLLEARAADDVEAVLSCLRRAAKQVEDAVRDCVALRSLVRDRVPF